MGQDRIITLVKGKDENLEVELLCAFELEEFHHQYIIYTKNEKDESGHAIIYAGKIQNDNGKQYLVNVDDIEWRKIKDIMKEMAKYADR